MTADLSRLAWRIAGALIRLLPTADWTDGLADLVTRILGGGDPSQITAIGNELRSSRNLLRRSDLEHGDEAEGGLYEQWGRRLELLLAAVADPVERAEAV